MPGKYLRAAILALILLFPMGSQAAEPPPLEAYGDLPAIENIAISNSGEMLAAISAVKGRRMLLLLNSDLVLQNLYALDDVKVRDIEWIGDEAVLMLRSETQRLGTLFTTSQFEALQAMIMPVAQGGEVVQIFADQANIATGIFGDYGLRQVDGKWTGYFGSIELLRSTNNRGYIFSHTRPSLFAVDLKSGEAKEAARHTVRDFSRHWLVDADGGVAATLDLKIPSGDWTISNGEHVLIAKGNAPEGGTELIALGKDGDTLLYSMEDQETGFTKLYEVELSGDAPATEILGGKLIERILIDDETGRFIGYLQGGQNPGPVFFDEAWQSRVDKGLQPFRKLDVRLADWNSDLSRLIVKTSGNGDSGTWYLVDIDKGVAKSLGGERPLIPASAVGPISQVAFTARDGLKMSGILTLPPGRDGKDLPVVMLPHGGPHAEDKPQFDWWAQAFASRGYAVFQPNFRGSTNMGQEFRMASRGEWGRKMQTDISDGLAELVRLGIADPKRACIMGGSYGGFAALAGVTLQQDIYRCAVAVAPVSDLELFVNSEIRRSAGTNVVRRILGREMGGLDLDAVSPRKLADRTDAPILLIHGKDDTVVPFEQSEKMADALDDAGKPYEFVVLEEEDHWLSRAATRKQMLSAAMAFVQKHNPAD